MGPYTASRMNLGRQRDVYNLLLLSLAAGSADATGYLGLDHVFTSNMTGNLVLLGIDLGQGNLTAAGRSIFVLIVFVLGVGWGARMGTLVAEQDGPALASRLMRLVRIFLVLFAVIWLVAADKTGAVSWALLALLSCSMGLQSAALHRFKAPGVATTAVTGTMTALTSNLVMLASARNPREDLPGARFQSGFLLLYCLGAVCCGFLMLKDPRLAGLIPALAVLLFSSPVTKGDGDR